jgi:hypothetical protein
MLAFISGYQQVEVEVTLRLTATPTVFIKPTQHNTNQQRELTFSVLVISKHMGPNLYAHALFHE